LAGKKSLKDILGSLFRKKEQAPSFSSPEDAFKTIEAAVQRWIDSKEYLLPDASPSESAARIGTTSKILYKYCQEVKGEDFRSFRSRLRIEEAKRILQEEPDVPISLVGRRVGINDRSNFTRLFHSFTGELPSSWKKNHKKD